MTMPSAPLIKQSTLAPTRKVGTGMLFGLITLVTTQLADFADAHPLLAFLDTPEFEAFLPVLVSVIVAYFVKDRGPVIV